MEKIRSTSQVRIIVLENLTKDKTIMPQFSSSQIWKRTDRRSIDQTKLFIVFQGKSNFTFFPLSRLIRSTNPPENITAGLLKPLRLE